MPDWLLSRETIIALAVVGGLLALAASALEPRMGAHRARLLNRAGYAVTAVSMALFIVVGLTAG